MISLADYFAQHRETPPREVADNALELLARVNMLLQNAAAEGVEAAQNPRVNSGWRPEAYNATVPGAAVRSKHITGQAIDIADPDGELDDWCLNHLAVLEELGLYMEHPLASKGWTHLQSVPPRSGRHCFYP